LKFTKELKTGILAVCAVALLIFGYSFLKGKNLLENDRTFYALYDNVEGLIPSSSVTINGLVVGQVTSINFANDEGLLLVEFNVNNDFSFSKNSTAKVYGGGLIGGKSLAIVPVYEKGLEAKSGDTLPGKMDAGLLELVNEKLTPLQDKLESAIKDADTLLTSVNGILSVDNKNNLNSIFNDLSISVKNFKNTSQKLNTLLAVNQEKMGNTIANAEEISNNLSKVSDSLAQINIVQIGKEFETVLANFDQISKSLEAGQGTAGKLLKDEELYDNLKNTSKQLELLLQDLRLNPKRYVHISVFGKKNTPYEEPEEETIK